MVPYSSPSNSIERVWALAKRQFKKEISTNKHEMTKRQFTNFVGDVLRRLPENTL